MYSSITAARSASVAASKLFSPGTRSVTNARGLVAPAVHVGNGDAVLLEQLLEAHLVLEREERARRRCGRRAP